jgi:hypothetical protein
LRLRSVDSILGQAAVPGQAVRNLGQEQLFAVSAEEPTSMEDAERQPSWLATMREELEAIVDNETWELTYLLAGRKPLI